jgi:para-aminobenzoate synthetase/4-amino-4-deoxychorismate lyase
VTARLRCDVGLRERFAALFPCGSIVGAPKVRAGEVIRDIEAAPRGVYTGAIGVIRPGGDMSFNVAIRTASITADGRGAYGVGGGIVADSDPQAEYDEALLKGRVLEEMATDYGLIETLRWSAAEGFVRLDAHLDRLAASARALGFALDGARAADELARHAVNWRIDDRRVRLLLARDGGVTITAQPISPPSGQMLNVGLAAIRLDAGDPFLRHKTTRRDLHEQAFAEAAARGFDEALMLNREGGVADGSRNSVFLPRGERLITPPLSAGALPGVLRAGLIASGRAIEGALDLIDFQNAGGWFLGNSLHGLRPARLA